MTLLVTGAAGHVGLALTRAAVEAGLTVVGIVRSPERIDSAAADELGPAVTWAACDLADAGSRQLGHQMADMLASTSLFSAAALLSAWSSG